MKWTVRCVVLCGLVVASASLQAHHSLAGVYALGKEAKVSGGFKESWEQALAEIEAAGCRPYAIPAGASDHRLGGLGFAQWAGEVERQDAVWQPGTKHEPEQRDRCGDADEPQCHRRREARSQRRTECASSRRSNHRHVHTGGRRQESGRASGRDHLPGRAHGSLPRCR